MRLRHLLHETSPQRSREEPDWRNALPSEWRDAAVAPLHIATWREHEMPACRSIGYGEEVQAWRLRDGRWLVWRVTHRDEERGPTAGFYRFSERMPR